jgi:hypothetical protein
VPPGWVLGQREQSVEKARAPGADEAGRQGDGQEGGKRLRTHRGEIAQPARETAVAGGLGGVPVAAEVDGLKREIGGDGELVAWGYAQDGAVVTYTGAQLPRTNALESGGLRLERGNKAAFAHT